MFRCGPTKVVYSPVQFVFKDTSKKLWHIVRFKYRWFVNESKHRIRLYNRINNALDRSDKVHSNGLLFDEIDTLFEMDWRLKHLSVETLADDIYRKTYLLDQSEVDVYSNDEPTETMKREPLVREKQND